MYELEKLFENTAFAVNFFLQLTILIVFLRMAWNIGKIRRHLLRDSREELFKQADVYEFIGKEKKAIETYKEYIYKVKLADWESDRKNKAIQKATERITALGGEYSNVKRKK